MPLKQASITINGSVTGTLFYRDETSDMGVLHQIFMEAQYDLKKLRRGNEFFSLYNDIVSSGGVPLILDAGANIGASAIYFYSEFKNAKIIAVEPNRENAELLRANTKVCENVVCVEAALSSHDGVADIFDSGLGHSAFRTINQGHDEKVIGTATAVSVTSLLNKEGRGCVPFIAKIDVEGAESDIFSKNTEWVDRFPVIISELHDWLFTGKANSANFLRCIAGLDRDFVILGENVFSLKNH